jgi:hypothetical protein
MKKVRPLELWDWKSIIGFILIVPSFFGLFILFDRIPDWIRNSSNKAMTETTNGKFVRSEWIRQYTQDRFGNHEIITGMLVEYSYSVDGKIYTSKDKIPDSRNNQSFFNALRKEPAMTLKVKYNPSNPEQSQINISSQ